MSSLLAKGLSAALVVGSCYYAVSKGSLGMESPELKIIEESNEGTQATQVKPQDATVPIEKEIKRIQTQNVTSEDRSKAVFGEGVGTLSLLDSYHLDDKTEKNTATERLGEQVATFLSCAYC
ncbi:hypothetical protein OIU84_029571 [Salix udensis]|uniref:Uncharacterized protein n=1 Tax=Salix udensis TaxID=889485 RepID=A0AAD6KA54_9ROSI|nr:hypothetical protein OIU84_029571 [Salix udensis]